MKKTVKVLTMVLALGISMSTMTCALGEGEEFVTEEMPEMVVQVVEEAPMAEAVSEMQAEPVIEAPVEQMVIEENTGVGNAMIVEQPVANEIVEIEDQETPLGLFDQQQGFTGLVRVARKGEGALYYGDQVTLTAQVSNANNLYSIRWEVNCKDDAGWRIIPGANERDYGFILTEANADYEYRVVLKTKA